MRRVRARLNDTDRTATKNGVADGGGVTEQRRLSQEAQEILKAAAAKDGEILRIRTSGSPGEIIKAGGKFVIPGGADHRVTALWMAGLEELEVEGVGCGKGRNDTLSVEDPVLVVLQGQVNVFFAICIRR